MPVADVVVPVYRDARLTFECLRSVLRYSGESLGRLFVVNDESPEPGLSNLLIDLRREDGRVRVLETGRNLGFIGAVNLGLAASDRDCAVLNSDARVTSGWLDELTGALAENPKHAALSPLSNNATMCSVPDFGQSVEIGVLEDTALDLSGLPRVTDLPTAHGFCLLLRRDALDAVGLFDRKFGRGYNEENDWCQRARNQGWRVGRANRTLVFHHGSVSFGAGRSRLDTVNLRRLVARYPAYLEETRRFERSVMARLAATAVRAQLGRLRVHVHTSVPGAPEVAAALSGRALVELISTQPPREAADVEVVTGLVKPGSHLVVTVSQGDVDALTKQLRWSQAVLAHPSLHDRVIACGLPPRRVHALHVAGLAEAVISVALRPDVEALNLHASLIF